MATARTSASPAAAKPTAAAAPARKAAKAAAKPAAKVVAKKAAKPAVKAAAVVVEKVAVQPAAKVAAAPATKPAKVKLVRDGFTIPATEYAVLGELKQRALAAAHPVKKSELLRAGIKLLAALNDKAFLAALAAVPAVKTGRPGKK